MAVLVVLVRHGERLDEADRAEWHRVRTEATRNDPPLTARGIAQSREAGEKLAALLRADGLDAGDGAALGTVYCSPTQRTADTAVQVAVQLRAAEVVPHHGLNCCAAAKKHGVELVCGPQPQPDTLHGLRLACWPPAGDPGVVNQRHRQPDGFVTTCVELAASAASLGEASGMPCPPVVLVTHREAIWEVQDAAVRTAKSRGLRYQMEKQSYCSVEAFEIDPASGVVAPHIWGGGGAGAAPPPSSAPAPAPAAPASSLAEVLSAGCGPVLFHRGGRDLAQSTRLWVTPGVRGVWVPDADVPDGEVVELLSTPQLAEGGEGEFVRIRRAAEVGGHEGWAKLKNLHMVGTTFG